MVIDDDETQTQGAANRYRVEVIAAGEQTTTCYPQWIATDGLGNFQTSNGTDWLTNEAFSASATGKFMRYNNGVLLLSNSLSCKYSTNRGQTWADTSIPSGHTTSSSYRTKVFDNEFWLVSDDNPTLLHGGGGTLDAITLESPSESPISIAGAAGYQVLGCSHNEARIPVEVSNDHFVTHASRDIDVLDDVVLAVSNGSRTLVGGEDSLLTQYTDGGSSWSDPYTMPSELGAKLIGGDAHENIFVVFGSDGLAVSTNGGESFTAITLSEEFHPLDVQIGNGLIVAVGEKNAGPALRASGRLLSPIRSRGRCARTISAPPGSGPSRSWASARMDPAPDGGGYYNEAGETFVPCTTRSTSTAPQWKDVATEICARASSKLLDHIDFDNMTDEVPGFLLGNSALKASDYLRTLNTFYFVNTPEYDGKLRSIRLGGSTVGTLHTADMLTVEDQDDDLREMPVVGWKRLTVTYPDPANNYVASTQTAPRTSPDVQATSEVKIECPIPFDADRAMQIADILQKIKFCELEGTFKRAFPAEYDKFIPSDAVDFDLDGRRYLILKKSFDLGMVQFEGRYDRASAYTSVAVGTNAPTPSPRSSNTKGPSLFVGFNSVRLRDADASPGIYVAIRGLLDGWPGCLLQVSIDDRASWIDLDLFSTNAITGKLLNAVPASGTREPIAVSLSGDGQVESVTADQVDAGLNRFAMVTDDVAEIGQFQTADENSIGTFDLSDVTAPQLGSTAAEHAADDAFVLCNTAVRLIPIDIKYAGKTIYFRPVTLGTNPEGNLVYGIVYKPQFFGPVTYEPITVDGEAITVDGSQLLRGA